MLLSEAIRQGAASTKPIHLRLYEYRNGKVVGCCVIGAALSAAASRGEVLSYHDFHLVFPDWTSRLIEACPLGCGWPHSGHRGVMSACMHLYDEEHWSREKIADWVGTLE